MADWYADSTAWRKQLSACKSILGKRGVPRFGAVMTDAVLSKLEQRLGRLHARQRLGIETDHEAQVFGQGLNFFHIENWYSIHSVIRNTLRLMGLYSRGKENAGRVTIRHNDISSGAASRRIRRLHHPSYQRHAC